MENVLPEQPPGKNVAGYTSAPPPGAGGPRPEAGVPHCGWPAGGAGPAPR